MKMESESYLITLPSREGKRVGDAVFPNTSLKYFFFANRRISNNEGRWAGSLNRLQYDKRNTYHIRCF